MIIGVGCDIVNHLIPKKYNWNEDEKFLNRVFSKREIALYKTTEIISFLAGRFAAKEAVLKCLGTGMHDGLALNEIEILRSDSGQPIIDLFGEIKLLADKRGVDKWHISITHSFENSIAYVVAERASLGE